METVGDPDTLPLTDSAREVSHNGFYGSHEIDRYVNRIPGSRHPSSDRASSLIDGGERAGDALRFSEYDGSVL